MLRNCNLPAALTPHTPPTTTHTHTHTQQQRAFDKAREEMRTRARFGLASLRDAFSAVIAQSSPSGVLTIDQFTLGCRNLFLKMDTGDIIALGANFNTGGLGHITYEDFASVMTKGLATNVARNSHFDDMRRLAAGGGRGPATATLAAAAAAPSGTGGAANGRAQLIVRFTLADRAAFGALAAVIEDPRMGGAVGEFSSFAFADPADERTLVWTVAASSATFDDTLPAFFGDARIARSLASSARGGGLSAIDVCVIGDVAASTQRVLEGVCREVGARASFQQPLCECLISQLP